MDRQEKIVAAITAGVTSYLQQEQNELQAWQQQPAHQVIQQSQPALPVRSPWSMSGRQMIMDRRYQLQMRLVR